MAEEPSRRLVVHLPVSLIDKVHSAAEISHRTVDQFVQAVLEHEIARWDAEFGNHEGAR